MARRGIAGKLAATLSVLLFSIAIAPSVEGRPVSGHLTVASGIEVAGHAALEVNRPLALLSNPTAISSLRIVAQTVNVEDQESHWLHVGPASSPLWTEKETSNATVTSDYGAASLSLGLRGGQPLFLALLPSANPENGSTLRLETAEDITIDSEGPATIRSESPIVSNGNAHREFVYEYARAHLLLIPESGDITLQGSFLFYLWNATLEIQDAQGEHVFQAGSSRFNETQASYEKVDHRILVNLTDATLTYHFSAPSLTIYADEPTQVGSERVSAPDARGGFSTGDTTYEAQGETTIVQGQLQLSLSAEPTTNAGLLAAPAKPRVSMDIDGDLTSTNLVGKATLAPIPFLTTPVGEATVAAGTLSLLVAAVWGLKRLAPLLAGSVVVHRNSDSPFRFSRLTGTSEEVAARAALKAQAREAHIRAMERAAARWSRYRNRWLASGMTLLYDTRALRAATDPSDRYRYLGDRAYHLTALGLYRAALRDYRAAARIRPPDDEGLYCHARALALRAGADPAHPAAGDALRALAAAITTSPYHGGKALADPAFRHLQATDQFRALILCLPYPTPPVDEMNRNQ